MIDYANSTVEEMRLFQAPTNAHLIDMAEALYEGAREITAAVETLRHMPDGMQEHIIRAKKSENKMEHLYRGGACRNCSRRPDAVQIIKMREIYRHLSNAADRGDEAADILSDILVKKHMSRRNEGMKRHVWALAAWGSFACPRFAPRRPFRCRRRRRPRRWKTPSIPRSCRPPRWKRPRSRPPTRS